MGLGARLKIKYNVSGGENFFVVENIKLAVFETCVSSFVLASYFLAKVVILTLMVNNLLKLTACVIKLYLGSYIFHVCLMASLFEIDEF